MKVWNKVLSSKTGGVSVQTSLHTALTQASIMTQNRIPHANAALTRELRTLLDTFLKELQKSLLQELVGRFDDLRGRLYERAASAKSLGSARAETNVFIPAFKLFGKVLKEMRVQGAAAGGGANGYSSSQQGELEKVLEVKGYIQQQMQLINLLQEPAKVRQCVLHLKSTTFCMRLEAFAACAVRCMDSGTCVIPCPSHAGCAFKIMTTLSSTACRFM